MGQGGHLSATDWGVIVAYLVGIVWLGSRLGRGQRGARDYFLGGRRIPWWGVGLAIVATETSALTFIGVPAMAFGGDLAFIQIIFGYVIARIALALFMVPAYFRGEIYSPYQLLREAFGLAGCRAAAALFLIAGTLAAGVRVYVTAIPVQLVLGLGEGGVVWAIFLFIGLSLIYTAIGGVKAVVWTDVAQFALFVLGGLFTLCYIPALLDGGWGEAWSRAAAAGKLHWLNARFSLSAPFNIWMGLLGGTFQVMASHGADQLIVQRVLSCRNARAGRRALILSAVLILPLFLLFLLTGVMLWAYYQAHPGFPIPLPEARPGVGKNDYVFPIFILTAMPAGLRGLLIVGILAAAMSSVSGALSALASVWTMDLLSRPDAEGAGRRTVVRGRWATLGGAALLALVALWTRRAESVLNAAFALNGLTSGALLGGLLLALWRLRLGRQAARPSPPGGRLSAWFRAWAPKGSAPAVTGMALSFGGMVLLRALWQDRVFWPWYTLFGTGLTLAGALAATGWTRAREKASERPAS
ncbi:MAG: sodium:solute symporter [Verrucomicrobia bacterium]|nr:sodium:solute symporter [Verrucomicrobiota bacterium]